MRRGLGIGSEIQYRVLISDQRLDLRCSSPGVVGCPDVAPRILLDLLSGPSLKEVRKIPFLLRASAHKLHCHGVIAVLALEEERELLAIILEFLDAALAEAEVAVAWVDETWIAYCAGDFLLSGLRCLLILLISLDALPRF